MLVHGPSSIWTQASSIPIETCAFVSTGGKSNGCENGVGVVVGVGVAVVYWIVNTGGLALSRVSNRFAVALMDSSPNTSQPKLPDGSSNHDWTSVVIWAETQVCTPIAPTDWLALTVAEKSPPCVVQKTVSKRRWRHVASLGVAGAPMPSSPGATDVPSPHSASNLCNSTIRGVDNAVLDICM